MTGPIKGFHPQDGERDDEQAHANRSRGVVRSAGVLGLGMVIARALGFFRDVALASFLGTGAVAEAWLVAFRFPNLLGFQIATGAFNPAFVPVLNAEMASHGRDAARQLAGRALTPFLLTLMAIACIGVWAAPQIVGLTAPGFEPGSDRALLAARLMRWCFIYLFMIGAGAGLMAIAQSLGRFRSSAIAPILMNGTMIVGIFFLCPLFGSEPRSWINGLVVAMLVGGVIQLIAHLLPLYRDGMLPRPAFAPQDPRVRRVARLVPATLLGVFVAQATLVVNTALASLLSDGSIASLEYATRTVQFPYIICCNAVIAAMLPILARLFASGEIVQVSRTLALAARGTLFLMMPIAVSLVMLAEPIVRLLFERGAFSASSSVTTASALACLAPIMISDSLVRVLSAGFFAMQDPRTPVRVAVLTLAANIALAVPLMRMLDVAGLALAAGLAPFTGAVILSTILLRRLGVPPVRWQRTIGALIIGCGAAILAITVSTSAFAPRGDESLLGRVLVVLLPCVLAVLAFGAVAWVCRVPEIEFFLALVRGAKGKRAESERDKGGASQE